MTHNQENIVEQLHKGVCTVIFQKTDGTERTMRCTLNSSYAPNMPQQQLNETSTRVSNPDVVSVWDTDVDSWRSFRIDSISQFNSPSLLNG